MSEERYIAAIEISSSKIVAAVGKSAGEGQLEVIAVEQERGTDIVRYGIIQNLEETSLKVTKVIERLQHRTGIAPRVIKSVYVGLSGRSVRSIPVEVSVNLPEETEIKEDVIARLAADAKRTAIDSSLEVIDAVPRIYKVGKVETISPVGTIGQHIQATFDLIVCRQELKRNLTRTIQDKLNIQIAGFIVTGLATGYLLLSTEEKRLGCMLVDVGAETTTVSIYAKNCLRYFATLPLGGRNITRDIQSLSLLEEAAEEIKRTSGNAIAPPTPSILNLNGVRLSDVSNLIVARSEEIVANIVEQPEYAQLKDHQLPSKIICIGGGSRLQNFKELLAQQSNLPVVSATLPPYIHMEDPKATGLELDGLVSILYVGATSRDINCLELPRKEELPVNELPESPEQPEEEPVRPAKERTGWMRGFKSRLSKIFGDPTDTSDLLD